LNIVPSHRASSVRCCFLLALIVLLIGVAAPPRPAHSASVVSTAMTADHLRSVFERVDSLRSQRQFREALALLSGAQNEHPHHPDVLYRLAFTWSDLGKAAASKHRTRAFYQQSLTVAEQAVQADSTSAWAHFAVAVAQGRLALHAGTRERVKRSRAMKAHAERAIVLDSTLAGAYHVRGRWHREAADLNFVQRTIVAAIYGGLPDASMDQAVRDFQTAIALEDRAYHHLELGKTYLAMDRPDAAREQFHKAMAVPRADPFDPEYKQEARQLLEAL
jgi:tetratricopeptide (TPR) repeat protein